MGKNRVWVVFQPHTYSRTKSLLEGFAEALPVADKVVICDIFPAREKDDGSIHSRDLADKIPNAVYIGDLDAAGEYLKENTEDGDMLITMGAGDVYKIGYKLCGK